MNTIEIIEKILTLKANTNALEVLNEWENIIAYYYVADNEPTLFTADGDAIMFIEDDMIDDDNCKWAIIQRLIQPIPTVTYITYIASARLGDDLQIVDEIDDKLVDIVTNEPVELYPQEIIPLYVRHHNLVRMMAQLGRIEIKPV